MIQDLLKGERQSFDSISNKLTFYAAMRISINKSLLNKWWSLKLALYLFTDCLNKKWIQTYWFQTYEFKLIFTSFRLGDLYGHRESGEAWITILLVLARFPKWWLEVQSQSPESGPQTLIGRQVARVALISWYRHRVNINLKSHFIRKIVMWSEFYVFDGTGLVKCGSMNGTPLRFLFTLQILRFGLVIFLTSVKPNKYEKFNEFFFWKFRIFGCQSAKFQ